MSDPTTPAKAMTAERADAIREAGARAARDAIKGALERHGASAEVMAATVEGLFAGAVSLAWRNRLDSTNRKGFDRIFTDLLAKALRAGTAHS